MTQETVWLSCLRFTDEFFIASNLIAYIYGTLHPSIYLRHACIPIVPAFGNSFTPDL